MKVSISTMRSKIESLDNIPSLPAILVPVMRHLEAPNSSVDLRKVADLIAHDKSLAAQTLHMANSPLFGRWKRVDNVRSAIVTLGLQRMREISTACFMLNILPKTRGRFDITVFWEHSLACALVSRRLAKRIGMADPEKAYLAGLLHDIGMIVNVMTIGEQFDDMLHRAMAEQIPIHVAEEQTFGFTHGVSGDLLAEQWQLGADLKEVIRRHHQIDRARDFRSLVAVVSLADLLCRMTRLGYGYDEKIHVDIRVELSWKILMEEFPSVKNIDLERLTFELDGYVKEVRNLVSVLFRLS
jgi:putative nucleotidyltransferase with HDIG domain